MSNPSTPLSALDGITAEDLNALQENTGVGFENYITITKAEIQPVLRTIEFLSKVSTDAYSKNLYVETSKDKITLKYNNIPYLLEYQLDNRSGCVFPPISIPLAHVKKLVGNVSTNLIFVWDKDQLSICLGENLVFVETVSFDPKQYEFTFSECEEILDDAHIKNNLKDFSSLLSATNNAAEKNIICKDESSYFNASAVFGKAKNFFGEHSMILSKLVIDAICSMAEESKQGIKCNVADNRITLEFVGVAKCVFPITTDPTVFETFLSPLFLDAFHYDKEALIANESLRQILSLVNALDYFNSFVRVSFETNSFRVIAHKKSGGDTEYTFRYLDGEMEQTSFDISIPVLLTVIGKSTAAAKYATSKGNLIVDLDTVVFCVRSNS